MDPGFGVRPALFSEGQNYSVRRTQATRTTCVMSTLVVVRTVRVVCQEVSACAPLSSQREQNYSVRRTQAIQMMCVMSILLLTLVVRGHPRILALTACAPLSSQREQNYSVRRPQSSRMVCVLSNSTAMSTTVMQSRVDTACASLSSQREQNYKAFAVLRSFE